MKIWVKLLLGSAVGIALGLFLPLNDGATAKVLSTVSEVILSIGKWVIFPLVFFSLAVGTFELRQEKKVLRVYGRMLLYIAGGALALVIVGVISVIAFSPARIPIIDEAHVALSIPSFTSILFQLFPANLFLIFTDKGDYLFPIAFLAFFLGLNFTFDRLITKPATQLFDSLSRIFYHINSFISEIIAVGMIALAAFFVVGIRADSDFGLFSQLIIVLGIDTVIIVFGIFPILLYYLGEKENPYRWLYGTVASGLTGFLSGNTYFSLSMLIRHGKESHGVPRKVGATTFPFAVLFGRIGTAFVTAVSFMIVLKSYSSLGVSLFQALLVVGLSFLVTFLLGSVPGAGSFVALSVVCGMYGRGLEQGFLILKPVAPILISFGTLIDVLSAALMSLLVARHEEVQKEIDAKDYV